MITTILEMLSYPFMVRAIVVGILVSLCAALLGTSLVLKRYSMIGDGLSHVGFAALAVAYVMNVAPLAVAIPVCILAAFLLLRMNENSKIKGDAATALMCSGALAIGVMTISVTTGMNTDVCNYMFGSILAMSEMDVRISIVLSIVVVTLFILFYTRIFAVTFDEGFAKATGTRSDLYNMIIAVLTAVTVVLGMRMMGTLLISSLIVFPSLSSMRVCKRFKSVIISSVLISIICFSAGIYVSYVYSTPTGASIVIANIVVFFLLSMVEFAREHAGISKKMSLMVSLVVLFGAIGLTGCGSNKLSATSNDKMLQSSTETVAPEDKTASASGTEAVTDSATLSNNFAADASMVDDTLKSDSELEEELGEPLLPTAVKKNTSVYNCDIKSDKASFDGDCDIVVGDNYYATQINDWYMNFTQYDGKTVEIEGYYINEFAPYDFIGRYGPTCPYCQGGYVCFELLTDEDVSQFQNASDWVKVKGILRKGEDEGSGPFYYIEVMSIEKMDVVGMATVSN